MIIISIDLCLPPSSASEGYETEQAEIEADRIVLEGKTEEKNTLMESIDELKEGIETKKGEVKKMENDLVGEYQATPALFPADHGNSNHDLIHDYHHSPFSVE